MISKVYLENWKTHRKSNFEFGKGTNVLVGLIGSGKSSVMDGICFALYGTFPALNARRINLSEVIMAKPTEMDNALVKVDFDYNGKDYSVERIVRRKGTNEAKLYCNNRFIAGPKATDVTKRVEGITEVNYDLFARAVYSEQNQIDYFLRLNPSQRKEQFDDLLQINRYEKARSSAVALANRIKKNVEDRKKILEEQKAAISGREMKEQKERLAKKKKEIKEIEDRIAREKKGLANAGEEIKRLEESWKKFNLFREQLIKTKSRGEEIARNVKETEGEIGGKSIEEINKEEKLIGIEINKLEERIKELKAEGEKIQNSINKLVQNTGINKGKTERLEKLLNQLAETDADCPVCRRPLSEHTKEGLIKENKAEIERLLEENEKLEKEKWNAEKESEKVIGGIEGLERNIENNKEKRLLLHELISKASAIERQRKELDKLDTEKKKVEKEIEQLHFDEKKFERQKTEFIEAKARIDSLEKTLETERELIVEIRQNLERMQKEEERILEQQETIGHLERIVEKLAIFTNALIATQAELRVSLISTINEAMDDIWNRIYPYEDYVSTKIDVQNGNYEVMVKERSGRWVRVEGILSGGERSAAAIALRIAVSLVLTQNLGWLVLDEPTHNLDRGSIAELSRMMKLHMPELVEQIFIITHDPLMEKAASSSLYVLERDKAKDSPTTVITRPVD